MGMKLKRLSSIGVGRFRRPSSSLEGGGGGVEDQQSQQQMMKRPSHRPSSSSSSHRTSTSSSTTVTSSRRSWGSSILKHLPSMSRLGTAALSYIPCQELPLVPRRSGNEIAIVACGSHEEEDCTLWKVQQQIQMLVGVTRVLPGYTGGEDYPHVAPNYENMYDHMYGLFIEYNPKMISYTEIISTACCHDDNKNDINYNKNGSSVLHPMGVTTTNDNNSGNKVQRRQPTVLFPRSSSQQHECIEYLHRVHDIVKRCGTAPATATDGTDRTSDESESSSGGDYNCMGDVGLGSMGDLIRRPLSIDIRQVGPFYKAEDRFCETGRSSAVL